ncbi:MAG: MBL fold metallo-hydrolase [Bdellovibrionales bacterium]|nr:MBL fold metallo-hydrolase [Bdellovibrionales bacterium]
MWIKASGALTESVFQLTTAVSSHLLVIGDASALIDTGVSAATDRLFEELGSVLGEGGELDLVLLTHAHFDHVGGLPALRKRYQGMEVLGSPGTAELLGNEDYCRELFQKNAECAAALGVELEFEEQEWIEAVRIDRIIGDGDAIDMGDDVEIKMIASPGHTPDSVSYLITPDAALAGGEAVGSYGGRDRIANCFTSDFSQYVESLERLSGLDLKVLSFSHAGALTGELVPKYFLDARQAAEIFREQVKERLAQGELVDEVFAALLPDWQAQNMSPEGPFRFEQQETLRLMIRAAAAE